MGVDLRKAGWKDPQETFIITGDAYMLEVSEYVGFAYVLWIRDQEIKMMHQGKT